MNKPQLFGTSDRNKMSIYFAIGITGIIVVMMTAVFPIWNLFPNYVTETVKVVSVNSNGCIAQTSGGYLVNIGPCNAHPDDSIMAKYDSKIVQRSRAFLP